MQTIVSKIVVIHNQFQPCILQLKSAGMQTAIRNTFLSHITADRMQLQQLARALIYTELSDCLTSAIVKTRLGNRKLSSITSHAANLRP